MASLDHCQTFEDTFLYSVSACCCIYGTQSVAPYGRTIQMASAPEWTNIASMTNWGKLSFLRVWQHRLLKENIWLENIWKGNSWSKSFHLQFQVWCWNICWKKSNRRWKYFQNGDKRRKESADQKTFLSMKIGLNRLFRERKTK